MSLTAPTQAPIEWADAKTIGHVFGLCRSTLYRLADEGKIRTSSLRERGKKRGKRLFSYDSVSKLIEARASGGSNSVNQTSASAA